MLKVSIASKVSKNNMSVVGSQPKGFNIQFFVVNSLIQSTFTNQIHSNFISLADHVEAATD